MHSQPPPGQPDAPATDESPPSNWVEAISVLVQSRLSLIQIELQELAKQKAKSIIAAIAAAGCLFFTWLLLLAGGIAWLAAALVIPWYWVSIAMAVLHLLVAVLLLKLPKANAGLPFSVTRAEFQKDREWIANLQKTPKS